MVFGRDLHLKARGRWSYLNRAIDRHGSPIDVTLSEHRISAYMNNRLKQDHRGIKDRIHCMRGFKSHETAHRYCREHGELRDLLGPRRRHNQPVSAFLRRFRFPRGHTHRLKHHDQCPNVVGFVVDTRLMPRDLIEPSRWVHLRRLKSLLEQVLLMNESRNTIAETI